MEFLKKIVSVFKWTQFIYLNICVATIVVVRFNSLVTPGWVNKEQHVQVSRSLTNYKHFSSSALENIKILWQHKTACHFFIHEFHKHKDISPSGDKKYISQSKVFTFAF